VVDTIIKNCRIVNYDYTFNGSIMIVDGKVSGLAGDGLDLPDAGRIIDAKGRHVIPGVIDPHVHLAQTEDVLRSETRSAAYGGITTMLPIWSSPSFKESFEQDRNLIEQNSVIDVGLSLNITAEAGERQVGEIGDYARNFGITSIKFQPVYRGKEAGIFGFTGPDAGLVFQGFRNISSVTAEGYPGLAMIHAENAEIIAKFWDEVLRQGKSGLVAWTDARPGFAEEEAMRSAIFLASVAKTSLYIVHMTGCDGGSGVDYLAREKAEGTCVAVETCPHYLTLTKDDPDLGNRGKVNPPLRDKDAIQKLWWGIREGVVDTIGSDHAPNPLKAKQRGDIWSALPGFAGMETLLPILLSEGVNKERINLQKLVEVCSYNTAKVFGLYPRKGAIIPGADADLAIIDLKKRAKVKGESLHSCAGWTPYEGRELTGWPVLTMVRGNVVIEDGEVIAKRPIGKYIPRQRRQP